MLSFPMLQNLLLNCSKNFPGGDEALPPCGIPPLYMPSLWEVFAKFSSINIRKVAVKRKLFRRKQKKNKNAEIQHGVCAIAGIGSVAQVIRYITPSTWSAFTASCRSINGRSLAKIADVGVARIEIANSDECCNGNCNSTYSQ